ncbi:hypothetical protein PMU79_01805 [Enterococcus durans]|uniref:hypothetical protein n=1 Tax=Enterococcus TaxID=1350 RepID=UPI001106B2CD|nr:MULTISPECIES: hypothetical protein [Enterococcus]MDB1678316.1 hypothetical protein [Enterococcus durans]
MIKVAPTILSNFYLIRRSMKSASKMGIRNIISILIVGIIYLECIFFQQYIQRFIHTMEQELIDTDQIGLNSNTFLIMQISVGRDIISLLIITITIYILFDFRNKFLLMKVINKEDVQTKIFLGVHPKYVLKELLMRNLFVYMEGFLLSYIICICIDLKLISSLNSILPYAVYPYDRSAIFFSMFLFLLVVVLILAFFSILIECVSIKKFKRTYSLY